MTSADSREQPPKRTSAPSTSETSGLRAKCRHADTFGAVGMNELTEREKEQAAELGRTLRQALGPWASYRAIEKHIGVSRQRLADLAEVGEIRAIRFGPKSIRVQVQSLAEFMIRRQV